MADKVKVVRVTKAQRFEDIKALLSGGEVKHNTDVEVALSFIDSELNLLTRKNSGSSKKQTEKQKENEALKEEIVELLSGIDEDCPGMTCTEIIKAKGWLADYSVSKISQLLRQLKDDNRVVPSTIKGKTLFALT